MHAELTVSPPSIDIPDSAWEAAGDYDECSPGDERARLRTTIVVAGILMHLEAYQVSDDIEDEQHVIDGQLDSILTNLVGDGAYPLATKIIDGREYILVATPYGA